MLPLTRAHSDPITPRQMLPSPTTSSSPAPAQNEGPETGSLAALSAVSSLRPHGQHQHQQQQQHQHQRTHSLDHKLAVHHSFVGNTGSSAAASRAVTPSTSCRPSFSHSHANSIATNNINNNNNNGNAVTIQMHAAAAATQQAPTQASSTFTSTTVAAATAGTQAPAKVGALDQLAIWQAKLDQLKKSLVPMLLTVGLGIAIAVEPSLSAGMTLSFPGIIAAMNIGLFVAAKQLPVDFTPR